MTRFPDDQAWERKCAICEHGQPVQISAEVWPGEEGGLVVLSLTPLEGFIHLVTDPEACIREYGPYRVSICQKALVSDGQLTDLRKTWNGVETTLPIAWVSGEGCMEVGKCPLTEDQMIRELHGRANAWYKNRPFHISG